MEVNDELYASIALPPILIGRRLGGFQNRPVPGGKDKSHFPVGIEV
jgi:hypothetical protein